MYKISETIKDRGFQFSQHLLLFHKTEYTVNKVLIALLVFKIQVNFKLLYFEHLRMCCLLTNLNGATTIVENNNVRYMKTSGSLGIFNNLCK